MECSRVFGTPLEDEQRFKTRHKYEKDFYVSGEILGLQLGSNLNAFWTIYVSFIVSQTDTESLPFV